MSNAAQKRAIENYRARLTQRGFKRFEVLALESDRELIRSLARQLAEEGPEAEQARAAVKAALVAGERQSPAASCPPCAVRPWSAPISICRARARKGAGSICDALSPRHQHYQQHSQAAAVGGAAGVVGRAA